MPLLNIGAKLCLLFEAYPGDITVCVGTIVNCGTKGFGNGTEGQVGAVINNAGGTVKFLHNCFIVNVYGEELITDTDDNFHIIPGKGYGFNGSIFGLQSATAPKASAKKRTGTKVRPSSMKAGASRSSMAPSTLA